MLNQILDEAERRMRTTVDVYQRELAGIRTGRAAPDLVSKIKVDYHGQQMVVEHLARIAVEDARTLAIQPWDAEGVAAISKGIQASDLGVRPNVDGNTIRITLPPLTAERRNELAKVVRGRAEEARIAVRNIRRDQNDAVKRAEKGGECSEDDSRRTRNKLQTVTDGSIEQIDKLTAKKETELTQV